MFQDLLDLLDTRHLVPSVPLVAINDGILSQATLVSESNTTQSFHSGDLIPGRQTDVAMLLRSTGGRGHSVRIATRLSEN